MPQKWASDSFSSYEKKSDDINTVWENPIVIVKKLTENTYKNRLPWKLDIHKKK